MSRTKRRKNLPPYYYGRGWSKEFGYLWTWKEGTSFLERRPLTKEEYRSMLVFNYRDCGGRWKWSGNKEWRKREIRYLRYQENNEILKWRGNEDYEVQVGYIKHDWWD